MVLACERQPAPAPGPAPTTATPKDAALVATSPLTQTPAPTPAEATPAAPSAVSAFHSAYEVGDAFIAATAAKDWRGCFRCFAPDSRDLVATQLVTLFDFSVAASGASRTSLDAIFAKHAFNPDEAQAAMTALLKQQKERDQQGQAQDEKRARPDPRPLVSEYLKAVRDKEAFVVDLLTWADSSHASSRREPPLQAMLKDVAVTGDAATATLTAGSGPDSEWSLTLKEVDGAWYIALPDREFAPSGWNDGFLFGYLDAVHGWRF